MDQQNAPLTLRAAPIAAVLVMQLRAVTDDPALAACASVLAAKMFATLMARATGSSMTEYLGKCETGFSDGMAAMVEASVGAVPPLPTSTTLN